MSNWVEEMRILMERWKKQLNDLFKMGASPQYGGMV